jgi:hypothetical protein
VGPRVGLKSVDKRKILHCRESNPDYPVRSYTEPTSLRFNLILYYYLRLEMRSGLSLHFSQIKSSSPHAYLHTPTHHVLPDLRALIIFMKSKNHKTRNYAVVSSSTEVQIFSLIHKVLTGSGAHPASYPMGIGSSFPEGNAAGREADHSLTSI